ncbi:flippase-like domain-containing protein [Candidatus Saccharibacteria bacterium]|nr:MAG: flippase-like domain-containing protein [Candidatus Saccharibacteria bacterium]
MNKRMVRSWAVGTVLLATIAAFIWYIKTHPDQITQLKATNPAWLAAILLANIGGMAALIGLYQVLVRMVGIRLPATENMLLTIYSSIANFFGPLQSGPGVRAAYLKAKHGLPLKRYVLVTLVAYAVFAVLSAFCLAVGTRPWWQTALAVMAAVGSSALVIHTISKKHSSESKHLILTAPLMTGVVIFTVLQILFLTVRFYLTLRASGTDVSLGQALSYTGAANFALFVSVTPDGIGIREAFLLFSQSIHGVATSDIVAASLVDRAAYILFLGLLFVLAVGLHAKERIIRASSAKTAKNALH